MLKIAQMVFVNQKSEKRDKELDFFMKSISDETYLDLIRARVEYLIDEGFKYSEQLEIINRESGRNISYNTYTNFVKLFILENPENLFQMREFYKQYKGFYPQLEAPEKPAPKIQEVKPILETEVVSKPKPKKKSPPPLKPTGTTEDYKSKVKIEPLKKPKVNKAPERDIGFKHEAMPNVDELY
jgi:hypothetical protein